MKPWRQWFVARAKGEARVFQAGRDITFYEVGSAPDPLTVLTERLRTAVAALWTVETASRQSYAPRPLKLNWTSTAYAGVQVGGGHRPAVPDLVEAFRDPALRQLVMLGTAGAGKTSLALHYVVATVTTTHRDEPVPVPLSLAAWRPGQGSTLSRWVTRRIAQDYPEIAHDEALSLFRAGRIILVLDGLDEIPDGLREAALLHIERAATTGMRMLITCRTGDYVRLVADRGALPHASVVDVQPVEVTDAVSYLVEREAEGSSRWEPVTAAMAADPSGRLATALSTPLMIALARDVYQRPATDPGELARLNTAQAVHTTLLTRFLPTVYGEDRGERVTAWLTCLAHRLSDHDRDPDLRWWRLARTIPASVLTLVIAAQVTVLTMVLAHLVEWPPYLSAGIGSLLGLAAGLRATRATRRDDSDQRLIWLRATGAAVSDLCAAVGLMAAGTTALLATTHLVGSRSAEGIAISVVDVLRFPGPIDSTAAVERLQMLSAAIAVLVVMNGLGAGRGGAPHQVSPRWRALPGHVLFGVAVGLFAVTPWALIDLVNAPDDAGMTQLASITRAAMATGAAFGVLLGVGRWLRAPVRSLPALTPDQQIRGDRAALLISCTVVATTATAIVLAMTLSARSPGADVLRLSTTAGVLAGIGVFYGSGSAWLSYTMAKSWLAITGRLPWRLDTFLRHAHAADVLRQAGHVYQIRHDLLREHLLTLSQAGDDRKSRPVPLPTSARRWSRGRWFRPVTTAAALLSLFAMSVVADPRTMGAPRATLNRTAFNPQFSADSRYLATIGNDDNLTLWDGVTGRHLAGLGRTGAPYSVAFSSDGNLLAASDQENRMRLWTTGTHQVVAVLDTFGDTYNPMFSSDGTLLATDGEDNRVRLWNAATGQFVRALGYRSWNALFSHDGRYIAAPGSAAARDGAVVRIGLWQAATGRLVGWLDGEYQPSFSPDDSVVATTDEAGHVRLWRTRTGALIAVLGRRGDQLTFSPDSRVLSTASDRDQDVCLWDVDTGRLITTFASRGDSYRRAKFGPDGTLVTLDDSSGIALRRAPDRAPVATIPSTGIEHPLVFSPDGASVVILNSDQFARVWDLATGEQRAVVDRAEQVALSPDGRMLATGNGDNLKLWRMPRVRQAV